MTTDHDYEFKISAEMLVTARGYFSKNEALEAVMYDLNTTDRYHHLLDEHIRVSKGRKVK